MTVTRENLDGGDAIPDVVDGVDADVVSGRKGSDGGDDG